MQRIFFFILSAFYLFNTSYAAYPFPPKSNKISDTKTANFFTEAVKTSLPAVVFIQAKSSSSNWISSLWGSNEEKSFIGSGFLITHDGYIITNEHVIKGAETITITLNNQLQFNGILVGADPFADIALIKIEAEGLPFLELADSDDIELGEWVAAIGSPFGLQSTVTFGIISNLRKDNFQEPDTLQVNLSINPGNSGGPLINLNGEVIGVNRSTWRYKEGYYTGLAFAIPSNIAKDTVEKLLDQEIH